MAAASPNSRVRDLCSVGPSESLTHQTEQQLYHAGAEPIPQTSKHWEFQGGPCIAKTLCACFIMLGAMIWCTTSHTSSWSLMLQKGWTMAFHKSVCRQLRSAPCKHCWLFSGLSSVYFELSSERPMSCELLIISLPVALISQ